MDVTLPDNASPGDVPVAVDVRDAQFAVVGDATVTGQVTSPAGESGSVQWRPGANGRYTAIVRAAVPGLYADVAMYRAKSQPGSSLVFFNPAVGIVSMERKATG